MRTALIALAAVTSAAAVAPAAPAAAQSAEALADVRCVLVLGVAARDPNQKQAAFQGTYYYLGRIDGRGLKPKLEALMKAEGKNIPGPDQLKAELTRCGGELRQRATDLQTTYQHLQAEAEAAKPAPAQ
ncbi:MAG: hypothetical protein GC203_09835 [Phenylobacterium sp.]|uniref:hypothetical protein n=1 Tax=Phenylobacterium sp. TaxID=1871053 RepID=UPI0025DAFB07|nr:hypothetical protein [Phenylobacterium sp.]MBI1198150.1 hypothetical protein [Phenylobacterium sp.]